MIGPDSLLGSRPARDRHSARHRKKAKRKNDFFLCVIIRVTAHDVRVRTPFERALSHFYRLDTFSIWRRRQEQCETGQKYALRNLKNSYHFHILFIPFIFLRPDKFSAGARLGPDVVECCIRRTGGGAGRVSRNLFASDYHR